MESVLKFIYMKLTFEERIKNNDFFFKLFRIWIFFLLFKGFLILFALLTIN